MEEIKHIKFQNRKNPSSHFDLIKLEELLSRALDHDITRNHIIEFYHILIITEGEGHHTIDFTDYSFRKGTVLTIRKDQVNRFFLNTKAKGYILLFTEDFTTSHFNKLEAQKSIQLFNELLSLPKIDLNEVDFDNMVSLVKQIEEEYDGRYDEFSVGIIRSVLHILITKLFRVKARNEKVFIKKKYLTEFLQFQALVEQHCFETKKVLDYAQKMNCTTKTINNVVRSILGKSAKEAIDEVVITQIKRLLLTTTLSIKEIAYASGFDEPTNLYKYFKKYTHTSPEAFRKGH